ncbi:uncharacterized protein LOC130994820 [Salvia miltiorrhiza]|uniref:uncharacterized protein LOC130994820 n=1 Tax=Salvia miltiorrhiza TaxID=226208 RepID=UPI0025AB69EA|nr:uncharacterized protein LOC130994820 [Salvia miltiorrhiza]XP_057775876.1 uncharacterized protein LOC130994820 [Salvia miltiorrhiza]
MDTPPHPHRRRVPSTRRNKKLEDDAEISEPGLAVPPEIPCFAWRAKPAKKNVLYLPKRVIEYYHLKIPNVISFVDEQGREWDVTVSKDKGSYRCSAGGWKRVCEANLIDIGDVCIFEFMQGRIDLYIRIRINRAHELRSKATHCCDGDIFMSGQAFRPENPHFVWRVLTEARRRRLILPRTIIKTYNLKIPNIISLVDERGKKWETKILKRRSGDLAFPESVWRSYCDANLVEIGDRCICEYIEEQSGLSIFVRVSRAPKLTRKKDAEEKEVEQVYKEPLHENNWDEIAEDESGMQRSILKGKQKLNSTSSSTHVRRCLRKKNASGGKKGFEEEKCAKTDKEIVANCNDCKESRTKMDISKAKRKLKSPSPHEPVRRRARKDKTFDRRKDNEEKKTKQIKEETMYLDPPKERLWKTKTSEQRSIEYRDAYIKKLEGIIKSLTSKDVNQKRVKLSCHKDDDTISSGSDIELINEHVSLQGTSMSTKCLPEKLELLLSYFQLVRGEAGQSITLPDDVFGKKYKIYIFLKDINKFCLLKPISDCCIISYMWFLHQKMKKENILTRFRFVNPNLISKFDKLTEDQRARALADRLIGASIDQLVLAPCNIGFHWILTVIQPYNKIVFLLDPLSHRIRDSVWQDIVNMALSMFCASKGENEKKSPTWVVVKAPLQPDSKQCGFYIMQYMREIIETCRDLGSSSLQSMFTKDSYSRSEIDEMRIEWAECILDQFG